jgi:hypothetical protein
MAGQMKEAKKRLLPLRSLTDLLIAAGQRSKPLDNPASENPSFLTAQ